MPVVRLFAFLVFTVHRCQFNGFFNGIKYRHFILITKSLNIRQNKNSCTVYFNYFRRNDGLIYFVLLLVSKLFAR
jgi:hypothetical protein